VEYADHIAVLHQTHPDLAAVFGRSDSLKNVLAWLEERNLPGGAVDIVGQDEFSYDFLVRLPEADHWLAFGVN